MELSIKTCGFFRRFVLSLWRSKFFFWTCVQAAIVSRVAIATTQAVAYWQMMPPVAHSQACLNEYDRRRTAAGGDAATARERRRGDGGDDEAT